MNKYLYLMSYNSIKYLGIILRSIYIYIDFFSYYCKILVLYVCIQLRTDTFGVCALFCKYVLSLYLLKTLSNFLCYSKVAQNCKLHVRDINIVIVWVKRLNEKTSKFLTSTCNTDYLKLDCLYLPTRKIIKFTNI